MYQDAETYQHRIDVLSKLGHDELGAQLKIVAKELDEATLPLVEKARLRNEFANIKAGFVSADKAIKLQEVTQVIYHNQAMETIKQIFAEEDTKIWCGILNTTGNTKALTQAATHVKSLADRAALLISTDIENSKIHHISVVGEQFKGTLNANDWAERVAGIVGGKSGGNKSNAQGAGIKVEEADSAIKLATEFANKCRV